MLVLLIQVVIYTSLEPAHPRFSFGAEEIRDMDYYRLAALVVLKGSRSQLTESFLKLQLVQIV